MEDIKLLIIVINICLVCSVLFELKKLGDMIDYVAKKDIENDKVLGDIKERINKL